MAAVVPPESPKRHKSPAEEVETSGQKNSVGESGCSPHQREEATPHQPTPSTDDEQRASVCIDGVHTASHSEVSVEPCAGTDRTSCGSQDAPTSDEKTNEASGGDQRASDWSETEDNGRERKARLQKNKCDPTVAETGEEGQQHTGADDATEGAEELRGEQTSPPDGKSTEKEPPPGHVGDTDGILDTIEGDEEAHQEQDADLTAKPKKCCLLCKECGQTFNRRETFNLHRHFHAHKDELAPLTCRDCGLAFQHRSSFIKHRKKHKEKEEQLVTPKKETQTAEEGSFQCAQCVKIFSTVDKLRDHNCSSAVEKPYHCPLCRQDFQYKVSITRHMMAHSQESMFTCQECSQTFPNTRALCHHQRCHAALKPYKCPECGMVFKHYSVMEDHRRKHTDGTRSHVCNICGKTFKYSSLLHQHQYLHTGQKPFHCTECGKKFAFAQNMKAHCRQHRQREANSSSTEQPSEQSPVSPQEAVKGPIKENTHQAEEPKRTFSCPLCPQTYRVPATLRAHLLVHEAEYEMLERTPRTPSEMNRYWEKGHTCPHCPCVYRDESGLKSHLLSFHKSVAQYLKKVAAPPQKQTAPLNSDNVKGKRKGDGVSIKTHKCSECGKPFRHRSVLELHMRIHSKDKPYKCKVCGKGFRFSSYLQQHLIIHTGKKPYKCPDCGKDFAFLQNMRTHQKLHQEKPFRCTSCRKGYSDETQLQRHMLSHNGEKPHKCNLCSKSFGLAYLLRDHMNTHTGERPHRCGECNKSFSWFSSLLVHQKIHTRMRQGISQCNSLPVGAKMRGRGSRGRRGGRPILGSSRPLGDTGMVCSEPPPYPASVPRNAELHRRAVQPQSSSLSPHVDLQVRQQEPWQSEQHPQPVQWKVDGGEVLPVPTSQQLHAGPQQAHFDNPSQPGLQQQHFRNPGWADSASIAQPGPASAQISEASHMKENPSSVVSSLPGALPTKSSPSVAGETEQLRQPKPPTSTVLASTRSLHQDFSVPTYVDGAALWSIRPVLSANSQGSPNKLAQELQPSTGPGTPKSTQKEPSTSAKKEDTRVRDKSNPQVQPSSVNQPEMTWNGCDLQKQWASGLPATSSSAQIDQSNAMLTSSPVSHGVSSTQTPPGNPKTIKAPEKLANNQDFQLQQKQVSSGWVNVQSQTATPKVPISIQYEPHRLGQGVGTSVWAFQSNPTGPQALFTGQLKPGNGQELQKQPVVTGTQIIINQPSPFFSTPLAPLPLGLPGPHPLHSVPVGALSRPPHPNIFFTPQPVMSERAHMTQTLSLPQLAPRTDSHKLGPRLPFAPERLLQCMICGCSLPRELDLQMHYLQHAQGEI